MLLYLIRHGRTDANAAQVYQGHSPHPLNEQGRSQASKLSNVLRKLPIRECFTSDLPRAEETAKIILEPHRQASLHLEPLLRDRDMGSLQGKSWVKFGPEDGEGVESDEQLRIRLHKFLDVLIADHTPLASPICSPCEQKSHTPFTLSPGTEQYGGGDSESKNKDVGDGLSRDGLANGEDKDLDVPTPDDHVDHEVDVEKPHQGGVVAVVTHEACILALLELLLQEDKTAWSSPLDSGVQGAQGIEDGVVPPQGKEARLTEESDDDLSTTCEPSSSPAAVPQSSTSIPGDLAPPLESSAITAFVDVESAPNGEKPRLIVDTSTSATGFNSGEAENGNGDECDDRDGDDSAAVGCSAWQDGQPASASQTPCTPFNTHRKLRALVRTKTAGTVDMSKQCGNTAVCVVRVWWEPSAPVPVEGLRRRLGELGCGDALVGQNGHAGMMRRDESGNDDASGDDVCEGDAVGRHGGQTIENGWRAVGRVEMWGDVEHLG